MMKYSKYKFKRWKSRWKMVFRYARIDSEIISEELCDDKSKKTRFSIFCDMIGCYKRYHIWTNQYRKERFWELSESERNNIGAKYKERNEMADREAIKNAMRKEPYGNNYKKNRKFLIKWTSFKYEKSSKKRGKRIKAYTEQYHLGRGCYVGYGVIISPEHGQNNNIEVGDKVLISHNVNIDTTGGIVIKNGTAISEGVKILTHGHAYLGNRKDYIDERTHTFRSPLVIGENVFIGTHAVIMPGVHTIGENSMISAGTVVTRPVPANTIVTGNPAQMVPIPEGMRTYYRWQENSLFIN